MVNPPNEPPLQIDSCLQLITNALIDAGIVGIDESIEPEILTRAFTQVNWLIAQWARKRWLVYAIQDYSFPTTGAQCYAVGLNQTININPRPDRLEYAFLRFLNGATAGTIGDFNPLDFKPGDFNTGTAATTGQFAVDIPLEIISSHEDYARVRVKFIGTFPRALFYDTKWPIGILRPWPVPQASLYEIHVGFKVVLPRFSSLQQKILFPPEYEVALNFCLVRRLRATYQLPADSTIDSLAREALNAIRLGNMQIGVLRMPRAVTGRTIAWDYRSDQN